MVQRGEVATLEPRREGRRRRARSRRSPTRCASSTRSTTRCGCRSCTAASAGSPSPTSNLAVGVERDGHRLQRASRPQGARARRAAKASRCASTRSSTTCSTTSTTRSSACSSPSTRKSSPARPRSARSSRCRASARSPVATCTQRRHHPRLEGPVPARRHGHLEGRDRVAAALQGRRARGARGLRVRYRARELPGPQARRRHRDLRGTRDRPSLTARRTRPCGRSRSFSSLSAIAGAVARPWRLPAWVAPSAAAVVALVGRMSSTSHDGARRVASARRAARVRAASRCRSRSCSTRSGSSRSWRRLAARSRHVVGACWILAAFVVALLNLDAAVVLLTPLYVRTALLRRASIRLMLAFQPVLLAMLASGVLAGVEPHEPHRGVASLADERRLPRAPRAAVGRRVDGGLVRVPPRLPGATARRSVVEHGAPTGARSTVGWSAIALFLVLLVGGEHVGIRGVGGGARHDRCSSSCSLGGAVAARAASARSCSPRRWRVARRRSRGAPVPHALHERSETAACAASARASCRRTCSTICRRRSSALPT